MPAKAEVLNKASSGKNCPHCDKPLDEEENTCPACGKRYWQPESLPHEDNAAGETEEEVLGCLPLFFWPLAISFAVTAGLIFLGFIVHVFSNFGANQIKAIWILCSAAAGGLVYSITIKIKRRRKTKSS